VDGTGSSSSDGADFAASVSFQHYDRRSLTYANTFANPLKSNTIRAMEWMTGKVSILRMIRRFEQRGAPQGSAFWTAALDVMGIPLLTPAEQLQNIPEEGPVVLVANHPHGLVDGMVLAELISRRRDDYKILTRSLLTGLDEIASQFLIPVPFPHEQDAQRKNVEMRTAAMRQLGEGGAIGLFPSGAVAASKTMFGPAVEGEWNVFSSKMIRRSGAHVVPVFFPGQNSRWYHMANQISPTLRQGLLLHEVLHSCNKPQAPVIGRAISPDEIAARTENPRDFIAWLRAETLALRGS
jgi:putative hemolysin